MATNPTVGPIQSKIDADIEQYGRSVIGVGQEGRPEEDGFVPSFSYTIGFWHSLGHPECVVFGVTMDNAHGMFNYWYDMIEAGEMRLLPWEEKRGLLEDEYLLTFLPGGKRIRDDYTIQASAYYERHFGLEVGANYPVYQVVWPDRYMNWPWDDGCSTPPVVQPIVGLLP